MIDGISRNLLLFARLCTTLGQIWKVTQQNFYTTSPYTDKHKNIWKISVIINLLHWILKILFCLSTNVIKEWNLASRKIWFLGKNKLSVWGCGLSKLHQNSTIRIYSHFLSRCVSKEIVWLWNFRFKISSRTPS